MSKVLNGLAWLVIAFLILIQQDVDGDQLINGWMSLKFCFFVSLAFGGYNIITALKE